MAAKEPALMIDPGGPTGVESCTATEVRLANRLEFTGEGRE